MVRTGTSSEGFSVVLLVVAMLVVLGAGLAGWHVWRSVGNRTPSSESASINKKQTAPLVDPSEGGKYLVIKEWNVRILLPTELQGDIKYGIRKNVNLASPTDDSAIYGDVAYFTSKKLVSRDSNCDLHPGGHNDQTDQNDPSSFDGGPGVDLSRTLERVSNFDMKVKDYWYEAGKGNAPICISGSNGTQEMQFIQATLQALKSVEATPPQQ